MTARLFGRSSKSKTQPSVDLSSTYSPRPQDQHSSTPQHYHPSQPQLDKDGQPQIARSPSQRHSHIPAIERPPVDVAGAVYGQPPSLDDRAQEHRYSYLAPNSPVVPPEKEQKRGFRERVFGGHSKDKADHHAERANRAAGVGRTLSVRGKRDSQTPDKYNLAEEHQRQQWALNHSSSSQLQVHGEEDEEQHNTFSVPQQYQGPPVPEKDQPHEQYYIQHPPPPPGQQPQDYYPPPLLHRVNTDQSYHSGAEQGFSPAGQHPAYQEDQHAHYQSYSEPQLHPGPPGQYPPAYPPPPNVAPGAQYQAPPPPPHGSGYTYNTPPAPLDQEYSRSARASAQQEPQSAQPGRSSIEEVLHHPQYQSQPDLVHPQATRIPAHQHSASQDPLFLQPPRTSSIANHPPPSPLQAGPGLTEGKPTTDQESSTPSPSDNVSTMPRDSGYRGGNSIRQVDPKNIPPPSREGSSLTAGNAPPTPGLQGQSRSGQHDESGRESPAPKSEMSEEEIAHYHQLMKDHKELRDKYQKVKKYYFEKEAQVHALQNTLAHQRLSQSRTSLDDSEYTSRFSRLDGLISQLAFSIRKSWKSIPDFLACCVNKDAIATGKQEMTAVGRAFISYWLVMEVFNRVFHPDLEIALSTQLKHIYNNIRRFAPPFQSGEEEEALNSKMINWRLTTFDGLQDQMKSTEAQEHRAALVAMLNDRLIKAISLLLVDPAPPDLQGGVYMIAELAVNITVHIPLESRDVMIDYYLPGTPIMLDVMKIETGIPVLTSPMASDSPSDSAGDHASLKSLGTGGEKEDAASKTTASSAAEDLAQAQAGANPPGKDDSGKKRGMFSGIIGGSAKLSKPPPGAGGPKPQGTPQTGSQTQLSNTGRETPQGEKESRVRLAVGVSVQIRGKSVLAKAPVYTIS